ELAARDQADHRDDHCNGDPDAEPESPVAQLRQDDGFQGGTGVPIRSTPCGRVKLTSAGSTAGLRRTLLNVSVERWPSLSTTTSSASTPLLKPKRASRKSDSACFGLTTTQSWPSRRPP